MKFEELLEIVGEEPVFASSLLRVGDVDPTDVAQSAFALGCVGRLVRLRRGVYALGAPYRKRDPHPFEIANVLVEPSYVSLESALGFHGLIPEAVFTTTSVTTARAATFDTALGRYMYRHISLQMMWGYTQVRLSADANRTALVARPEKALLDLVYLRSGADSPAFLRQLRLERLDTLDVDLLMRDALRSGRPKLQRAARRIAEIAEEHTSERVNP